MKLVLRHPFVKLAIAVVLTLLVPSVGAPPSPAGATHSNFDTATGDLQLVGKGTFSRFPCASTGATQCIALFKGGWVGGISGTTNLNYFDVHWETDPVDMATGGELGTSTSRMHSLFYTYDPICTPTFEGSGFAHGYATRGSGHADATVEKSEVTGSTYTHTGQGRTEQITDVHLDFEFEWARTVHGLGVTFSKVTLSVKVPSISSWITVFNTPQLGSGTFELEDPGYDGGVPGCDAPLTGMETRLKLLLPLEHAAEGA